MKKILYLLIISIFTVFVSCQCEGGDVTKKGQKGEVKEVVNDSYTEFLSIMKKYEKRICECTTREEIQQCIQDKNSDAIEFLQKYGKDAMKGLSPEQLEKVRQLDKDFKQHCREKYDALTE